LVLGNFVSLLGFDPLIIVLTDNELFGNAKLVVFLLFSIDVDYFLL